MFRVSQSVRSAILTLKMVAVQSCETHGTCSLPTDRVSYHVERAATEPRSSVARMLPLAATFAPAFCLTEGGGVALPHAVDWSSSLSGRFTPRERIRGSDWMGFEGGRVALEAVSVGNGTPFLRSCDPYPSHRPDWVVPN